MALLLSIYYYASGATLTRNQSSSTQE